MPRRVREVGQPALEILTENGAVLSLTCAAFASEL